MGRHSLRITIVLGLLITILGSTGIFAVFNDQATTGPNNVTSGALPLAADLKIAVADLSTGEYYCDRDLDGQFDAPDSTALWLQDLTLTPHFNVANLQPGETRDGQAFCLHNNGSAPLSLSVTALNVIDSETDCTGDESAAGDLDCGVAPAGLPENPGELGGVISVEVDRVDCAPVAGVWNLIGGATDAPAGFNAYALGVGAPLAPGATTCIITTVRYPSATAFDAQQRAQTDRVTWQFEFDGVAS
jgi:hypothetical protein